MKKSPNDQALISFDTGYRSPVPCIKDEMAGHIHQPSAPGSIYP